MGAKGRLFNDNDQLVVETSYLYNSTEIAVLNSPTASLDPAVDGAAYYGYGITVGYNGNGYDYYYTFKTPKQNAQ